MRPAIDTSDIPAGTAAPAPPNLHVSVSSLFSAAAPLSERMEQKFFVPPQRIGLVLALLRRTCRVDPQHPFDRVNSLYFDTADLDQHERSLSGEFAKDKVRIRWYGEEHDPHRDDDSGPPAGSDQTVPVWLELKSRRGFAATKQRLVVQAPATALSPSSLGKGIVPPSTLLGTLGAFGYVPRGRLWPVVAVSYHRYRFIEPRSGFRVSLDTRIRSSLVMPGLGSGERGLELPGAVVEAKGPSFTLPPALRPLAELGASWTRYSKYSSSLDGHAAPRGGVSRLWPSGVMQKDPAPLGRVRTCTQTTGAPPPEWKARLASDRETG